MGSDRVVAVKRARCSSGPGPGARRAQRGLERPPQRRAERPDFRPRRPPRPGGGSRFPRAAPIRPRGPRGGVAAAPAEEERETTVVKGGKK